jgi:dTDP-4-amino-4,6-dideoxy-D-galactose acyltransferase
MYEELKWDSDFFEVKVGKINRSKLTINELNIILNVAKNHEFKLIYWSSDKMLNPIKIQKLNGIFVDKKTTLEMPLNIGINQINLEKNIITEFDKKFTEEIEELSIQSAKFSRYAIDKNISRDKFQMLYRIWIRKSIQGEIADNILIAVDNGQLAGMITLGNKNGKGDIGLLCVKEEFRGRKIGQMLLKSAQKWLFNKKYSECQVITQGNNIPAINLYKKCSFSIVREEFFYHFWI